MPIMREAQAQSYLAKQSYQELVDYVQDWLAQDPQAPSAYAYGLIGYLAQEDIEAAQALWLHALLHLEETATVQVFQVLKQVADQYQEQEDTPLAGWLRQWIWEVAPEDTENLLLFAEFLAQRQDFARLEALNLPEQIRRLPPEKVNTKLLGDTLHLILQKIPGETLQPWHQALLDLGQAYVPHFTYGVFLSAILQYHENGNTPMARTLLEWCIEKEPQNWDYQYFLVGILYRLKEYRIGLEKARQLCELSQQQGTFLNQLQSLATMLQGLLYVRSRTNQEVYETGQRYIDTLERLTQCTPQSFENMLSGTWPFNIPFWLPYLRDDLVNNQRLKRAFVSQVTACLQKKITVFTHAPRQREKLRVGFLSHTLKRHSVGWLLRWYLRYCDRQKLDIYMYSLTQQPDGFAHEFLLPKSVACHYYRDPNQMAKQIYQDGIDILIDLDSVTLNVIGEVLAYKPAPVLVDWLGWDAMGSPTVDYFVVDPYVLPEDAQAHYSETLWRLPHCYIAVDGFEVGVPTLRRDNLGIPAEATVFYSAQISYKRHYETVRLQLDILREVPNSYLLIKGLGDQQGIQEFFCDLAQEQGVNPDRLKFLERDPNEYIHRANMAIADVILDTYPYNGATTTLEALWVGVPLVTRVGQQYAARNSYSFLVNCGVQEGIAWNAQEYVEWGIRLGTDAELRRRVRQTLFLSRRTSPLWNARQFAREFDRMLWQMWERYLAQNSSFTCACNN
ncbi:MAG: hypothetical protein RMI89_03060 [Gloeomargarita sp. SKYBB_i_bin120]|nr:hypothetical protein [Gloeomargarita sp. SKYG98]MCS7291940.1 hypothetical protein [Gloeomargarita sp. SKYB120]MDW8177500.1 hypothetical protein [Gloeomargarita sp. SKYBB_i_bin120]